MQSAKGWKTTTLGILAIVTLVSTAVTTGLDTGWDAVSWTAVVTGVMSAIGNIFSTKLDNSEIKT